MSNGVTGEHFVQGLANSRFDWRVNVARANRDEPDLREVYYERPATAAAVAANTPYVLSDESQSGFRMFNALDDDTVDASLNWAMLSNTGGRPTQYKFGVSYVERNRDFQSRRFRYIPIVLTKDGPSLTNNTLHAGRALHDRQHRQSVPLQRRDAADRCVRRPSDHGIRIRDGGHRFLGPHAHDCGRARRGLQTGCEYVRSVRALRSHGHGDQRKHRLLPGHQLRPGDGGQLEPAIELRGDGQPAGVPRVG